MNKRFKKIILLLGDLLVLNLALLFTLLLRYGSLSWSDNYRHHLPYFLVVFAIWLVFLYISDLYNLNFAAPSKAFFKKVTSTLSLSLIFSVIYFYLNVNSSVTPRTNLLIFSGLFIVLFLIWRTSWQALNRSLQKNQLVIIGNNQYSAKLQQELQKNPGAGYELATIIKDTAELAEIVNLIKDKNIRTVVICDDFGSSEQVQTALFACLALNLSFYDYPSFYELLSGKVPVEAIGPDWFLNNLNEGNKNYFNFLKRLLDLLGASLLILILIPLFPLIALIIKLESRGPVFFTQERYGRNEQIFKILKFRTMRTTNNHGQPTSTKDNRITPVGNFLRKTRLDELPQAINIFRGEMSFIGPRPERPELVKDLELAIPFYKTRLLIKPGISGWDQVSGTYHSPSPEDTLEKLQYDLFYLKHRSLYLDLVITLKTIATVLGRGGR